MIVRGQVWGWRKGERLCSKSIKARDCEVRASTCAGDGTAAEGEAAGEKAGGEEALMGIKTNGSEGTDHAHSGAALAAAAAAAAAALGVQMSGSDDAFAAFGDMSHIFGSGGDGSAAAAAAAMAAASMAAAAAAAAESLSAAGGVKGGNGSGDGGGTGGKTVSKQLQSECLKAGKTIIKKTVSAAKNTKRPKLSETEHGADEGVVGGDGEEAGEGAGQALDAAGAGGVAGDCNDSSAGGTAAGSTGGM